MDRPRNGHVLRAKQAQNIERTPGQESAAKRDDVLDSFVDNILGKFTDPTDVKEEDQEAAEWAKVQGKNIDEVRAYLWGREDVYNERSEVRPDPEWRAHALRWYDLRGL